MKRNGVQAADRLLQILMAFTAQGQELSVGVMAEKLGVHKSSASRLAATLAGRGFLQQDPRNKAFRLGPEMCRLGFLASDTRNLESFAHESMEFLAAASGETVNLGVLEGAEVINIAQADGDHIVGVGMWTGKRTELHCTSNGKVFLAFANAPIGKAPLKSYTKHTFVSPDKLRAHLEIVRRDGWAYSLGELEDGLHAVAVPIFDAFDRCRAALSVSGPSYRMPAKRFPEIAALCKRTAREIETRLGRNLKR